MIRNVLTELKKNMKSAHTHLMDVLTTCEFPRAPLTAGHHMFPHT